MEASLPCKPDASMLENRQFRDQKQVDESRKLEQDELQLREELEKDAPEPHPIAAGPAKMKSQSDTRTHSMAEKHAIDRAEDHEPMDNEQPDDERAAEYFEHLPVDDPDAHTNDPGVAGAEVSLLQEEDIHDQDSSANRTKKKAVHDEERAANLTKKANAP
jgi:hypothetical protein